MAAPTQKVPPRRSQPGNGQDLTWYVMSTLVAGPATWGGIGAVIDHFAGTDRLFLPIGIVVGVIAAFYLVKVRFFRSDD